MTVQLDLVAELTITPDNVREYMQDGFRFEANVSKEDLPERYDNCLALCGFGFVLVGPTVDLSTKLPARPEWQDPNVVSLFIKPPAVPDQRTR